MLRFAIMVSLIALTYSKYGPVIADATFECDENEPQYAVTYSRTDGPSNWVMLGEVPHSEAKTEIPYPYNGLCRGGDCGPIPNGTRAAVYYKYTEVFSVYGYLLMQSSENGDRPRSYYNGIFTYGTSIRPIPDIIPNIPHQVVLAEAGAIARSVHVRMTPNGAFARLSREPVRQNGKLLGLFNTSKPYVCNNSKAALLPLSFFELINASVTTQYINQQEAEAMDGFIPLDDFSRRYTTMKTSFAINGYIAWYCYPCGAFQCYRNGYNNAPANIFYWAFQYLRLGVKPCGRSDQDAVPFPEQMQYDPQFYNTASSMLHCWTDCKTDYSSSGCTDYGTPTNLDGARYERTCQMGDEILQLSDKPLYPANSQQWGFVTNISDPYKDNWYMVFYDEFKAQGQANSHSRDWRRECFISMALSMPEEDAYVFCFQDFVEKHEPSNREVCTTNFATNGTSGGVFDSRYFFRLDCPRAGPFDQATILDY